MGLLAVYYETSRGRRIWFCTIDIRAGRQFHFRGEGRGRLESTTPWNKQWLQNPRAIIMTHKLHLSTVFLRLSAAHIKGVKHTGSFPATSAIFNAERFIEDQLQLHLLRFLIVGANSNSSPTLIVNKGGNFSIGMFDSGDLFLR